MLREIAAPFRAFVRSPQSALLIGPGVAPARAVLAGLLCLALLPGCGIKGPLRLPPPPPAPPAAATPAPGGTADPQSAPAAAAEPAADAAAKQKP